MSHYGQELEALAQTYADACAADVTKLKSAIAGASDSSVICAGSGGSFTVASLLCNLHEAFTGRVSRPSTPLELVCNPTLAATSPVFLISAEGKNPDILTALKRARKHSARSIHVITNKGDSPLLHLAQELSDVRLHLFGAAQKDGYLATNTLLLNAILIARAYAELDSGASRLPATLDLLRVGELTLPEWLATTTEFVTTAAERGAVLAVYSPLLKPIATDLESKLAEAALLHCQTTDLRSFAHGRHLWAARRADDCAIITIVEPTLARLWQHTRALLPPAVPSLTMNLSGATPADLITGIVAQMHLVGLFGDRLGVDPGSAEVPKFGRDIYYAPVDELVAAPPDVSDWGVRSKAEVLGALWPSKPRDGTIARASADYRMRLQQELFRAVVFDYDGTLCTAQDKDKPLPESVVKHLLKLLDSNVIVAIASGRGDSLQQQLREALPKEYWEKVPLALYNGGWVGNVGHDPPAQERTSEFLSHVTRIVRRLQSLGAPIEKVKPNHPYQVSVRFQDGIDTHYMWFVIADSLREAGLDLVTTVRSRHSVDILSPEVNKSLLLGRIIGEMEVDPYKILTMGDQGAWPGNDAGLLEHRFSLSVDWPSRRMDRGWKMAPPNTRNVGAALWYLERFETTGNGTFRVRLE